MPVIDAVKSKDPNKIFERVLGASGKDGPLLKLLPESYRATAAETIQDYGGQVMMVRDTAYKVMSTDFTDINSVNRVMASITGDPNIAKYVDGDGIAAAFASVVIEAKEMGLPSLLQEVASAHNDIQTQIRIAMNTLGTAINFSDTRMLYQISEIVGKGNLVSANPKVISQFIRYFELDEDAKTRKVEDVYRMVLGVLDSIDPTWRFDVRFAAPTRVLNGVVIRSGSQTFQELMSNGARITGDQEMTLMMATYALPSMTTKESARHYLNTRYVL